ncbi:hypothetical protein HYT26_02870 [Candidatus Pacearchaeota archaeon]|nr:hypothetical protein [Candidatus Pacearchaeota archaeon]
MPKEVLYVGLDESNHHNGNEHPEVCVAAFSTIKEDRECQVFNSKKDYSWKDEMLKDARRDYRFLLLNCNDIYPQRHNNLPVVAKSLILPVLKIFNPERLEIYIDGVVTRDDKDRIIKDLPLNLDVYVQGFIKYFKQERNFKDRRLQGKINSKKFKQPPIVKLADIIAHELFSCFTLEKLSQHEKRVSFLA